MIPVTFSSFACNFVTLSVLFCCYVYSFAICCCSFFMSTTFSIFSTIINFFTSFFSYLTSTLEVRRCYFTCSNYSPLIKYFRDLETYSTSLAQISFVSYIFFVASVVVFILSSRTSRGVLGFTCNSNFATLLWRFSANSSIRNTLYLENISSMMPSLVKLLQANVTCMSS